MSRDTASNGDPVKGTRTPLRQRDSPVFNHRAARCRQSGSGDDDSRHCWRIALPAPRLRWQRSAWATAGRGGDLGWELIRVVIVKPRWRWNGATVSDAPRRPFTYKAVLSPTRQFFASRVPRCLKSVQRP